MLKNKKLGKILIFTIAFAVMFTMAVSANTTLTAPSGASEADASNAGSIDTPHEVCVVSLTGLTDEDATILVYKSTASLATLTNDDILYIKQTPVTSGNATFTFVLKDENTVANYTNGPKTVKVAVGGTSGTVQYAAFTVTVADTVDSISVSGTTANAAVGTGISTLTTGTMTLNYHGGTTETINLNDSRVALSGSGEADTIAAGNNTITASLNLNGTDPTTTFSVRGLTGEEKSVTVKNDSSAAGTVEYPDGATYTLPAAPTKTNYQFVGWGVDDGTTKALYPAAAQIAFTKSLTVTGQWVRIAAASTGLRYYSPDGLKFSMLIDKVAFDELKQYDPNAVYGTIIAPYKTFKDAYIAGTIDFTMADFDAQTTPIKYMKIINTAVLTEAGDVYVDGVDTYTASLGDAQYNSVITGVDTNATGRKALFAGRGFVGYKYAGSDVENYVYADFGRTYTYINSPRKAATTFQSTYEYSVLEQGYKNVVDAYAAD